MNTQITPEHADDVVDVWEMTTPPTFDDGMGSADTVVMPATTPADPADPAPTVHDGEASDRRARLAAAVAAVVLVVAVVAFFASRGGSSPADEVVGAPPATVPVVEDVATPPTFDVPDLPTVVVDDVTPPVVAEVPVQTGGATPPPVPGLDVQEPPPAVSPPVPQAPESPAPAPLLGGQLLYELDPGVDNVTVTLANEGDAPLTFSVAGGAQFSVDATSGEIPAGGTFDLWVEMAVAPVGDGPTLYEVPIEVTSDGGDLTIVLSGQVEKPGFLVADVADLPLVDHRGVLTFTNVGELPIEITGVDAPGLTTDLIPDAVAPGATWELEIAICADTTLEPQLLFTLDGQVGFRYDSFVTVTTPSSESTTTVSSFGAGNGPLPSCEPVIDPLDVLVMEVTLP